MTVKTDIDSKRAARAALEVKPSAENPDAAAQVRMRDLPDDLLREIADNFRVERD